MSVLLFLPVAYGEERPQTQEDTGSQTKQRSLHIPRLYICAILAVIAAYLAAIFKMDSIACDGTATCNNYSKLEWSFSQSAAETAIAGWTSEGRAAMALSAGLHIFSSFLFCQLFIFGGLLCESWYRRTYKPFLERASSWIPVLGRIFNVLYCAAHSTIASIVVSGTPSSSGPVAAGVLIILSLILLIICALFLIGSFFGGLVTHWMCKAKAFEPVGETMMVKLNPAEAKPVATVV